MLNGYAGGNIHQDQHLFNDINLLVGNAATSNAYIQQQQQQNREYQIIQRIPQQHFPNQQKLIPEVVREYLRNKKNCDCIMIIYHAKVVQKSYGTEKRFFAVPPLVYLRGKGWKSRNLLAQNAMTGEPTLQQFVRFNNEPISDYDYEEPIANIGIDGSKEQGHRLEWQKDPNGRCAIKALHISGNDNNRKKYFTLSVHCFHKSGQLWGKFQSKRIKVISKPSKKKNITNNKQIDIKNQDINIASGTEVALFSRVKSQTTNTRYLFVKDGKFVAHSKFWGSFTIHLIDERECEQLDPYAEDFNVRDGFINYGSIVKLVDNESGLALPMMKICKIDKQCLVDERDSLNEQVSQLHKCAFQMLNNNKLYLCFTNDQIVQKEALSIERDGQSVFQDGAQWAIISTDTTQYRFYQALGPVSTEISPVPIVNSLETHASDTIPPAAYVELKGLNFKSNLQVWIGSTQVQTLFINKELIRFALPPLSHLNKEEGVDFNICVMPSFIPEPDSQKSSVLSPHQAKANQLLVDDNKPEKDYVMEFPLLLARDDGAIYATQHFVTYSKSRDNNLNNNSFAFNQHNR